jgi:hypothetical protein
MGRTLTDSRRVRPGRGEISSRLIRSSPTLRASRQISCHSFRATGIPTYMQNDGKLEIAQQIAGDGSTRTTGLYDRRDDSVALDEVERVVY